MRTAIYSLRDRLTNTFFPPFHSSHDIAAARAVVQLIRDPQARQTGNNLALYPGEHDLVRVAEFDDVEGVINTTHTVLGRCDTLSGDSRYFPAAPEAPNVA